MPTYNKYAKLGSIEFEPLNGFNSFEKTESSKYAEHALLNSKNLLQPTGEELKQITIGMRLIALGRGQTPSDFTPMITVDQMLIQLRLYRANNTAIELVWANGNTEGQYVILDVKETIVKQFADGTRMISDVVVNLKEYFEPNPLQKQELDNRKNAPAVGDKKSNAVNSKTNAKTCPQTVSDIASQINMYAAAINQLSINYGLANNPVKNSNLINHITKLKIAVTQLLELYFQVGSCLYNNQSIHDDGYAVQGECNSFISAINYFDTTTQPTTIPSENTKLQNLIIKLKADLLPFIKTATTRNG